MALSSPLVTEPEQVESAGKAVHGNTFPSRILQETFQKRFALQVTKGVVEPGARTSLAAEVKAV